MNKVDPVEADNVIQHITNNHFLEDLSAEPMSSATRELNLSKKYIFFYIAHDLIFKQKNRL